MKKYENNMKLIIEKYNRFVIYGRGKVGKLVGLYLSYKKKDFKFYDDYKNSKDSLKNLDEILEYTPEVVIIAIVNKEIQKVIKEKIKFLKCKILEINIRDLPEIEIFILKNVFNKKLNLNIFEKNCFIDAIKNGYLEKKCNFKYQVPLFDSYFYNDIRIEENDVVIDGGASCPKYKDCTALYFASLSKNLIHAFEPLPESYENLKIESKKFLNVKVYPYALGNKNKKCYLKLDYSRSYLDKYSRSENTIEIDMRKLDDIIKTKIDFIKMDIEGSELIALEGAQNLIKKYKPKLSICVYHNPEDVYKIPEFIKKTESKYKIWLVNNEGHFWMGTKIFAKVYNG